MPRRLITAFICSYLCAGVTACGQGRVAGGSAGLPPDARVRALADSYLTAFFDRNPDQATIYGVPGRHHNQAAR
jgi:hypothetical protein